VAKIANKKSVVAWAFYDWANSAFATTVIAGFFPVFFKQYWSAGATVAVSTFWLGTANSISSVVVALLAPFLGAIADKGSSKKKFLVFFSYMGVVMTCALYLVGQGDWPMAVTVFVLASIGFSGSIIFYDSLLVSVSDDKTSDIVSAIGYSFGYIGGGLLFGVNVFMTLKPQVFGLADASQAVRVSFVTVGLWWAVFTIPVLLFVKEPRGERIGGWAAVKAGFNQLNRTIGDLKHLRIVLMFLIGYFLYIDAVQTIARMAVDYGLSLGFQAQSLITALLITQFVGFPSAIAFGKIGERIGAKAAIYIGIAVYTAVCIYGYFMKSEAEFYVLAVVIGLVQGGIQSLSRSFYSRIIPKNKAAEFFGFFNMLGKFSTVIGPILMGWIGVLTGNPRFSILSVIVLFVAGWALLVRVDEAKGKAAAEEMESL
jgi:UMF1 family MFS transporter